MTLFETDFAIGDKAFTVRAKDLRIVEITVGKISCYKTEEEAGIYLHPLKENGDIEYYGVPVEACFHAREELLAHLNSCDA